MPARGPQFQGPLFHGTSVELQPGERVLPPAVAKAGTPNSSHPGVARRYGTPHDPYENASASRDERTSWEFAAMTSQRRGGRAAVYKVARPDDAHRGLEPKEVLSKQGFPVVEREDIRPPETVRAKGKHMRYVPNPNGRQGTLPIDWTPPGGRHGGYYATQHGDLYNHPTQQHRVMAEKRIAEKESRDADWEDIRDAQFRGGPKASQPMLPGMRGSVKRQPKRKPR